MAYTWEKLLKHVDELKSQTTTAVETVKGSKFHENVSSLIEKTSETSATVMEAVSKNLSETYSRTIGAVLSESNIHNAFLETLSQLHSHAQETDAYRAAIDSLAHAKGFGGAAFHRIADGQHSLFGAMDAIRENCPDADFGDRLAGALSHLWSDFHSSIGVPAFSFENMESFNAFCDALHLSPETVQDFLTINSTELLGSALTIIPALFRFNEMQAEEFASLAGRLGILTAFSGGQAEIISGLFALAMLGKAYFMSLHEGESTISIVTAAAKEGGWTGGSLVTVALLPFPFSIAAVFALTRIRSHIETNGLEASAKMVEDYTKEFMEWVKEIDLSSMMKAAG